MSDDLKPEAAGGFAAPHGSAIAHQSRRRVWEELEALKTWTARLESELQKEPHGVIPWIPIQILSEATNRLLYAAGHVNALRLAGVSPNDKVSDPATPPMKPTTNDTREPGSLHRIVRHQTRNQNMNIEELTIKVRAAEENMTNNKRCTFWSLIAQGYCRECGRKDPQGRCQCWNDE